MMEKGWDGTMKSYAVLEDGSCRTVEIPTPEPGPYEALVRIEACGVCNGTDSKPNGYKLKCCHLNRCQYDKYDEPDINFYTVHI